MESTVIQRIKAVLLHKDVPMSRIAEFAGIKQNTFSRQVGGESALSAAVLSAVIEYFPDISPEWLITGKGDMIKSVPTENGPIVNYEYKGAPYYNVDFIGGFDLITNDQTINPDYYINYGPYNKPGVIWCNVTGHSMEPEIYHGDTIAIKDTNESNVNYLPFGEVYAIVTDNYRTIKRLSKSDKDGYIRLVPTNKSPEYAPQDIPVDKIKKVYQVLASVKRF